ncbi:MAG: hypothetical protein H9W81_02485 [Enterococcus sp.]|nr:hypothetical protein [Enterococcus sp.]
MAITSKNGKYLTLENVRVFYDKDSDQIIITSKDPDIPADSKGFKISVNGYNETGSTLRQMLGERGMIPDYNKDLSPEYVTHSELPKNYPWHTIPLGKTTDTDITEWDTQKSPNMFIIGKAGSGKSNMVYNILEHCLAYPQNWEVAVFDPIFGDRYGENFPGISEVGLNHFGIHAGLLYYMNELQKREKSPSSIDKKILLVIEGLASLFEEAFTVAEPAKEVMEARQRTKEIGEFLMELAKRGKSAGIHLVVTAQRVDNNPPLPSGVFLPYFDAKMVCENYDSIGYRIFTDAPRPLFMKPRRGKSYLIDNNGNRTFQAARYEFRA